MKNERMHQELLELVATGSASGQERAIADLLTVKLRTLGFTVTMDDAGEKLGGNCGNIFAWREGERSGSLLLCSHMDRVADGFGIVPVEDNGILRSSGDTILAADDISGVCSILEGLRRAIDGGKPLPRLEVLFTVSEEAGLLGGKLVDVSRIQSKIGLFFDSPGPVGRIINAAPGMYFLSGTITGRAAHAGNEPEKGVDASRIMCEMLSTLRQGRLDEITTSNFPILSTTAKGTNVVCDSAFFRGEARSRDAQRLEDYVAYFKAHCEKVVAERGAKLELSMEELFRAFEIGEGEPVLRLAKAACEKVGINCRVEAGGGGMDANVFNAKGISCVGVATGYYKNHTKDEYLVLEDFYRAGDLAAAMIECF